MSDPRLALKIMLLSMFTDRSALNTFLWEEKTLHTLRAVLPGDSSGLEEVVVRLIEHLRARRYLPDLFAHLRTHFPKRTNEIDTIAQAFETFQPRSGHTIVVLSNEELSEHRRAVAERLHRISKQTALEQSAVPGAPEADLYVVLLGWSTEGINVLRKALAGPEVISLGLKTPPDMAPITDFAALAAAQTLQRESGILASEERRFQSTDEAAQRAYAKVRDWIEAHQPEDDAPITLLPWEQVYLNRRRKHWASGSLRYLQKLSSPDKPIHRDQIYVPLRIDDSVPWQHEESPDLGWDHFEASPTDRSPESMDKLHRYMSGLRQPYIERVLCQPQRRHLIIEGRAGAGKTALLQHVAHTLATMHQGCAVPPNQLECSALHREDEMLPVPLFLLARDIARKLSPGQEPGVSTLLAAIADALHTATGTAPPASELLMKGISSGRYMLLVDSLDEVPRAQDRREVVKLLSGLADSDPGCRLVLTTRPITEAVDDTLYLHHLAPLDRDGVRALAEKWEATLGRDPGYAVRFLGALEELEGRQGFVLNNPLFLTATFLVYDSQGQHLPEDTAELYDQMIETLCNIREHSKLPAKSKRQALQSLAEGFLVQGTPTDEGHGTEWPKQDAARWLAKHQSNLYADEREASEGLQQLINDTGLLHAEIRIDGGRRQSVLRPEHRTFQEYLAACQLTLQDRKVALHTKALLSEQRYTDPNWRGVLSFLPGAYALTSAEHATTHLETLFKASSGNPLLLAHVANAIAEYRHRLGNTPLIEKVILAVVTRFAQNGVSWPLEARLQGLDALGRLGDPRLKSNPWVSLPAGSFWMGGDEETYGPAPGHQREMPEVRISWRPVTVADFKPFVEKGYQDDDVWGDAPAEHRTTIRGEPESWSRQYHHPNRPVVGVSWWEARAYCRWASKHLRDHWHLQDGQQIDLPSEAEWEYAARGACTQKTAPVYPWGNTPPTQGDTSQASWEGFADRGPGHPTPVGTYPLGSRDGITDLAGNVFEWCIDDWRPAHHPSWENRDTPRYFANKPSTNQIENIASIVRGGSWIGGAQLLHCSCRSWGHPENRSHSLGFRVVVVCVPEHNDT